MTETNEISKATKASGQPAAKRPTVGILYICTGKYQVFWAEFYRSFREKFLPECDKEWFVFTDAPTIAGETDPGVHRIYQEAWPWPYSSMRRFTVFLGQEAALAKLDYLFFFNANLVCLQTVTAAEFLPRKENGETLLMVQQPGFYNKKPIFYTYERRPASTAYIPYNCGRWYVSGGANGGSSAAFLALCHVCEARTETDIAAGITPIWHDESELNRYVAEQPPQTVRVLTPAYWYPEGWQMPFEQKISVLDKNRFFDMAAVKGAKPKQSFFARKWEAFCLNYLPWLWLWRDTLLHRHLP